MSEINFDPIVLTQSLVKCASITPKDKGALKVVKVMQSKERREYVLVLNIPVLLHGITNLNMNDLS